MSLLDVILTGLVILSTAFSLILLALPSQYNGKRPRYSQRNQLKDQDSTPGRSLRDNEEDSTIQVLVLGDIGRSPRMQYHALSIAQKGVHVQLIGYKESEPNPALLDDPLISIIPLPPSPALFKTENRYMFLLLGPLKVLWQVWELWHVLAYRTKPAQWLLVQNPPSIPTLAIALCVCFLRNTSLVIDWHNYGWSILAMRLGESHPLVQVARRYEYFFGRFATANLTVTDVMARSLREKHNIPSPILPLHDRPSSHFRPLTLQQRAEFLSRLPETADKAAAILSGSTCLLVSSTSWTADEDFSLLLDALVEYSSVASRFTSTSLPDILAIITGKGPQQAHYHQLISRLNSQNKLDKVTVITAWLSTADYASLLGAADVGVSLHVSSSGLDLPMKVVDMFGAGLPVLGWSKFDAWSELVREGVNGKGFGSAQELARLLVLLLVGDRTELRHLKQGALREGEKRWDDEWDPVVGKLLGLCDEAT